LPDPAPPLPSYVDLRNFGDMPLAVSRLRDSEIAGVPDAEVFRCAVLAWCAAWHQVPAASLPDDDAAIARMVGMGRDVKGWKKLRQAGALRGFRRAADGRLYHHVIAEKACEAWNSKLGFAWRRECDSIRKTNKAAKEHGRAEQPMPPKPPSISSGWSEKDAGVSAGIPPEQPPPSAGIPPDFQGREGIGSDRIGDDLKDVSDEFSDSLPRANGHDAAIRPPSDNRRPGALGDVLGRFVTTGPPEKRLKRQDRADADMVRWLTTHGGFDVARAWALLMAARDENEPDHTEASRELERISAKNRLGWFAEEPA